MGLTGERGPGGSPALGLSQVRPQERCPRFHTINPDCPRHHRLCAPWDVRPASHGRAELLRVGVHVCRGLCRAPRRSKQVAPVPTRCVPSRVDADSPGDCRRELSLVSGLMRGARVFLTREETQHFLKE